MREIKFKFWDKYYNKFDEYHVNRISVLELESDWVKERFVRCQFSGIKDKNGKEIYENDIVRFTYNKDIRIESVWFYSASFNLGSCIDLRRTQIDEFIEVRNSLEVIGNIYENPELLS